MCDNDNEEYKLPIKNNIKYCCINCDFFSNDLKDYKRHKKTKKHQKRTNKYICELCGFYTNVLRDYKNHQLTQKHIKNTSGINIKLVSSERTLCLQKDKKPGTKQNKYMKDPTTGKYHCVCGKEYSYTAGLCRHLKKCNYEEEMKKNKEIEKLKAHMKHTIEENSKAVKDLTTAVKNNPTGNTTINNYNKMTINVFLNEKCKNAMNLTDFINNVKISLEDLSYSKDNGYVKGICNILQRHLKDMSPTERPIHCNNKKEMFYIKDEDKWENKKIANTKIDKSINDITYKQMKKLKGWEKEHPEHLENEEEFETWNKMIKEIVGGDNKEESNNEIKKALGTTIEIDDAMVVE
jgi:hypothetical protein